MGYTLPLWFTSEEIDAWDGYCAMRQELRKLQKVPFTERAMTGILKDLEKLRAKGENIVDVLDQSTKLGWRGVFPVKRIDMPLAPRNDLQRQLDNLMGKQHGNVGRGQKKPD